MQYITFLWTVNTGNTVFYMLFSLYRFFFFSDEFYFKVIRRNEQMIKYPLNTFYIRP